LARRLCRKSSGPTEATQSAPNRLADVSRGEPDFWQLVQMCGHFSPHRCERSASPHSCPLDRENANGKRMITILMKTGFANVRASQSTLLRFNTPACSYLRTGLGRCSLFQ
jgi:hypothetical protein